MEQITGQKRRRRVQKTSQDEIEDDQEAQLMAAVFGDDIASKNLGKEVLGMNTNGSASSSIHDMFHIDTQASHQDEQHETSNDLFAIDSIPQQDHETKQKVAWTDADDADVAVDLSSVRRLRKLRSSQKERIVSGNEYSDRLRQQFEKSNPDLSWAQIPTESESSTHDEGNKIPSDEAADTLLRTTGPIVADTSVELESTTISVDRLKDANHEDPSKAVVQSVHFHPNEEIMLTAGLDKTLRLFRVDGKKNKKVTSIFFKDLPMHDAKFTSTGREIICVGRRPFFYSYDVTSGKPIRIASILGRSERSWEGCAVSTAADAPYIAFLGKDGHIPLVSSTSKQLVGNLKMNGQVRSAAFTKDGLHLVATGTEGQVYRWDLRTRRCIHQHIDDGSLGSTTIGLAPDGRHYAVGSTSGVVNLYDADSYDAPWRSMSGTASIQPTFDAFAPIKSNTNKDVKPVKAFMNLTTSIDSLVFNHDTQLLAMSSSRIKDQFRLVHVASRTVFQNWPTSQTPLHYVSSVDFSPHSGYVAIGNDRGRVLLYRLNHYSDA